VWSVVVVVIILFWWHFAMIIKSGEIAAAIGKTSSNSGQQAAFSKRENGAWEWLDGFSTPERRRQRGVNKKKAREAKNEGKQKKEIKTMRRSAGSRNRRS
jgi:hypothetical protein